MGCDSRLYAVLYVSASPLCTLTPPCVFCLLVFNFFCFVYCCGVVIVGKVLRYERNKTLRHVLLLENVGWVGGGLGGAEQ